jgi:hypothetical protein
MNSTPALSSAWRTTCPVSETAAPRRLGAALTYARRYALFTLVGIAGEDDLDAPDLPAATLSPDAHKTPTRPEQGATGSDQPKIELKPGRLAQASNGRARAEMSKPASLPPDASANLRHQLIAELEQLVDPEALATWAQRALPLKNQLATADAQTIEAAFAARLTQIQESEPLPSSKNQKANKPGRKPPQNDPGDQAVTTISKPVRERDHDHLKFVTSQPCLVCGRTPSDAHHIRFAEQRAMARKVKRQVRRADLPAAPS